MNIFIRKLTIIFLLLLIGCQNNQSEPIELSDEASIVYSSLLDSIARNEDCLNIILIDSTIISPTLCYLQMAYTNFPFKIKEDTNALVFKKLWSEYASSLLERTPINFKSLRTRIQVNPISITKVFQNRDSLSISCGLFAFSKVVFTQDTCWAFVIFESYLGNLAGKGQFILLHKINGKWINVSSLTRWTS